MYKYLFGFLGCGNMASAIAESFLAAGKVKPDEILLCDKEISKTETFAKRGCGTTSVPSDVTENCRFVFCAVKPQSFSSLCEELSGKINCEVIISIMAGIKIKNIEKALGVKDVSVVRIMPNLACRFGCGVTLVEFNGLNEASKSVLKNALLSMGQLVEIPEKEFNFATSVSGCGPAFFQLFYKYIYDECIKKGFASEVAREMVLNTAIGSATLAKKSDKSFDELISAVCSKGGSTIEGVNVIKASDMEKIIATTIEASRKRNEELENLK